MSEPLKYYCLTCGAKHTAQVERCNCGSDGRHLIGEGFKLCLDGKNHFFGDVHLTVGQIKGLLPDHKKEFILFIVHAFEPDEQLPDNDAVGICLPADIASFPRYVTGG